MLFLKAATCFGAALLKKAISTSTLPVRFNSGECEDRGLALVRLRRLEEVGVGFAEGLVLRHGGEEVVDRAAGHRWARTPASSASWWSVSSFFFFFASGSSFSASDLDRVLALRREDVVAELRFQILAAVPAPSQSPSA